MSTEGGTRAIIAALLANLGIAVTKFLAFLLTHSSSMLAESIHSVADSSNQGLLLLGGKRAKRAPTAEHPFGYGRERYLYAFIVAIVLFSVGGLFALYEGYHKLHEREGIHSWHWVPVVVLVVAIVLETFSFRTAIVESNRVRGKAGWVQFVRHSKSPELPVVLLEDLGALLGLIFALIGVSLTLITGDGLWDGLGTIAIGLLLVSIAVILGIETKSLLLGEGASPEVTERIVQALQSEPLIERVIHMRTLHIGPEELLVAAKIAVRHNERSADIARAINSAERRIREVEPIARVIYLEPDIYLAARPDDVQRPVETAVPADAEVPSAPAGAASMTEPVGGPPAVEPRRPARPDEEPVRAAAPVRAEEPVITEQPADSEQPDRGEEPVRPEQPEPTGKPEH